MALGFRPLALFALFHQGTVAIVDEDDIVAATAVRVSVGAAALVDEDDTVAAAGSLLSVDVRLSRSLAILCRITWPNDVVTRMYDGSGPFLTEDGEVWRGVNLLDDLDALEVAMNGEAYTLNLSLTGVSTDVANAVWLSYTKDEIIGAKVELLVQPCDTTDQPVGDPETRFTGDIDNIVFDDRAAGDAGEERAQSRVTVEVTNRFSLRRLTSGSVLSDIDQKARSAALNPGGDPDRCCERIPLMADRTIVWPRLTS